MKIAAVGNKKSKKFQLKIQEREKDNLISFYICVISSFQLCATGFLVPQGKDCRGYQSPPEPPERSQRKKERCSGSFHLADGFLVIKDDSISERPG